MTGRIADLTSVQFRMLNRSKGAAMWSPRAQCDKREFSQQWRRTLENTVNLYIWQDAATEILFDTSDAGRRVRGVKRAWASSSSVVPSFLPQVRSFAGEMYCGGSHAEGGRAGDAASTGITESLVAIGFEAGRMKTGTPARLDARTINFEILEPQWGDENPSKFSFDPDIQPVKNQLPCFLVHTSAQVHDILRGGFDRSPLFDGTIRGIGPRYCPSIEDKLRTFADRDSHQLFLEPEGRSTNEYYLNGFSSSLPWEVQLEALHGIRGFEDLHIYRPGYAIEYDYFPPTQLHHSLATKLVDNLFSPARSTVRRVTRRLRRRVWSQASMPTACLPVGAPFVLARDQAYIGVLIDDLVTKGVDEPYRMFTSRAEYRILLRQDNADMRLTEKGYELGLVSERMHRIFLEKIVRRIACTIPARAEHQSRRNRRLFEIDLFGAYDARPTHLRHRLA